MKPSGSEVLVQQVIERFSDTPDPRLREILGSLVRHLHAFIQETRLTEAEWMQGIEFLTAVGQKCDGQRQEFILLSDVLGASMQVVAMQAERAPGCTDATVFGPFHVEGAPAVPNGGDVANGAPGTPCVVHGTVRSAIGETLAGATVDVWQSDDDGLYDVQRPGLESAQGRGVLTTDDQGSFWFQSVLPMPYPIPTDGPVGALLRASLRSSWRPAHLHFRIQAPGFETLITHVFRSGDPHLNSDPVFGVRPSLVRDWPATADGGYALNFDFVLHRAD
jgi:hydroxyquinol 1,2-dioxygenase